MPLCQRIKYISAFIRGGKMIIAITYPRERMACQLLVGFLVLLMPSGGSRQSDTYHDSKQEHSHLWKTQACYKCNGMAPLIDLREKDES